LGNVVIAGMASAHQATIPTAIPSSPCPVSFPSSAKYLLKYPGFKNANRKKRMDGRHRKPHQSAELNDDEFYFRLSVMSADDPTDEIRTGDKDDGCQ
jgi:hypothetical protein